LAKVDALIDEARRRQLEIDRDALTGADPRKTQ